jgi:hypothetical protein
MQKSNTPGTVCKGLEEKSQALSDNFKMGLKN